MCVYRKYGSGGILGAFIGGGGSPTKIVLTLDDLVFINTTLSRRVGLSVFLKDFVYVSLTVHFSLSFSLCGSVEAE